MTGNVLFNVQRKHNLWKRWKDCNDDIAYSKYKKEVIRQAKLLNWRKQNLKGK